MNIKKVGSNMTELKLENGTTVLFSYESPVAAGTIDGWFKTEQHYSQTTSKHITKWLEGIKPQVKPQSFFNNLVGEK